VDTAILHLQGVHGVAQEVIDVLESHHVLHPFLVGFQGQRIRVRVVRRIDFIEYLAGPTVDAFGMDADFAAGVAA